MAARVSAPSMATSAPVLTGRAGRLPGSQRPATLTMAWYPTVTSEARSTTGWKTVPNSGQGASCATGRPGTGPADPGSASVGQASLGPGRRSAITG